MSPVPDRARQLLSQAEAQISDGRSRKAAGTFARAFDLLAEGGSESERRELLHRAASGLEAACRSVDHMAPLHDRAETLYRLGMRRADMVTHLVRRLALEDARTDPEALETYIGFLEGGSRLDEDLATRLNQILSFVLHVRLSTPPEEAESHVPLLLRLNRCRPRLTFPKLYLGRYHYVSRDYASARRFFGQISGRLADRPKVLNVQARCAEKLDLIDEALDLYRRSLRHNHHQPHVHFRVGRLLLRRFAATVPAGEDPLALETP